MKVVEKLISSLLIAVLVVSFTGCAPKFDISPEALEDYADDQGAEEYKDPYTFGYDLGYSAYYYEDGLVFAFTDKYVCFECDDYDNEAFEEATTYPDFSAGSMRNWYGGFKNTIYTFGDEDAWGYAISISYGERYDSSNYGRRYFDEAKELYESISSERGYEYVYSYSDLEYFLVSDGEGMYLGVYYDYSTFTMFIVTARGNDKDAQEMVDDICKDFKLVSPTTI